MKTTRIFTLLLLVSALPAACQPQEVETPPTQVTVQLAWAHQAQFAGFYAADQQGYYAEEGLEVTLLPRPRPETDTVAVVTDGTADFGVTYGAGMVIARSQGLPVTAIATIYRRYPLAFMTLASSGLARPHDFPGHTINTLTAGGSAVVFQAMMTKLELDRDSVREVDVGYDLSRFFTGEVDIYPAYIQDFRSL